MVDDSMHYGNTICEVFKPGGTKLERLLPKNQHTQRKLLNFENWCQKMPKFDYQSQFSMSKIIGIWVSPTLSHFFSLKNINLGAHFLLLTFFDNINF